MANVATILIIDDSISSCFYMAQALEKAGYQVITASDGREGLTKVLQERLQCVVLDIVLPKISGFELCRQLRNKYFLQNLPIVMVSSKDTSLDRSWGLRQGANAYLVKPFAEELLVQTVKEVLLESATAARNAAVRSSVHAERLYNQQEKVPPLQSLIPQRSNHINRSWIQQPAAILDSQARLLYALIDGRKNVEKLCDFMQIDRREAIRALRLLLSQHRIQLYEPDGRLVDSSRFFFDR